MGSSWNGRRQNHLLLVVESTDVDNYLAEAARERGTKFLQDEIGPADGASREERRHQPFKLSVHTRTEAALDYTQAVGGFLGSRQAESVLTERPNSAKPTCLAQLESSDKVVLFQD